MKHLLLACALALPCSVDAGPRVSWSISPEGPSSLELTRDGPNIVVNWVNNVTNMDQNIGEATLDIDGFVVRIEVFEEAGRLPDHIVVTPPPGYFADPNQITIGDGDSGIVILTPVPLS